MWNPTVTLVIQVKQKLSSTTTHIVHFVVGVQCVLKPEAKNTVITSQLMKILVIEVQQVAMHYEELCEHDDARSQVTTIACRDKWTKAMIVLVVKAKGGVGKAGKAARMHL